MTRFKFRSFLAGLLAVGLCQAGSRAASGAATNDFQEIYDLIRAHVTGVSDAELNRAAIQGLLTALGPRVSLVTNGAPKTAAAETPLLSKVTGFDDGILYLRVARVAQGLDENVAGAFQRSAATNKLKGLVLDLRYSGGTDYAAAADTADLFISKARPLLNWGSGSASSHEKTNAIQVPLAVLENGGTAGAAEALAAVLREAGAGLILGRRTAGQAMVMQGFPLKNGDELRIATARVTLGDGSALPSDGVKPDIEVVVNPDDEHAYYADAFYVVPRTNTLAAAIGSMTNPADGTNAPRRTRFNEAELVREHREGLDRDTGEARQPGLRRAPGAAGGVLASREAEAEPLVVSDPALARALDLLNGLAVVRQSRS